MIPTTEDELVGLLLEISVRGSLDFLDKHGTLAPWGVSLVGPDYSPRAVSPLDGAPEGFTVEWLQRSLRDLHVRALETEPATQGFASVVHAEQGSQPFLMIQVETLETLAAFAIPYARGESGAWAAGDISVSRELHFPPVSPRWAARLKQ